MAMGAKPAGALPCVEPMMTNSNIAVITTSHTSTDTIEYLPGDRSPQPLVVKPPTSKPGLPLAMRYSTAAAAMAPITCATTYGTRSLVGNRPPAHRPKLTAGFKWQPEMWPMA